MIQNSLAKAERMNAEIKALQEEVNAYLEWACDPLVSGATRERMRTLLVQVRKSAEAAVDMQGDDYSVAVVGLKRNRNRVRT